MDKQIAIIKEIDRNIQIANDYFNINLERPRIRTLKDVATVACLAHEDIYDPDCQLGINWKLAIANYDDFIYQAIPHEIAHLVEVKYYKERHSNHGSTWKSIMLEVFDREPKIYHEYDISSIPYYNRIYRDLCLLQAFKD